MYSAVTLLFPTLLPSVMITWKHGGSEYFLFYICFYSDFWSYNKHKTFVALPVLWVFKAVTLSSEWTSLLKRWVICQSLLSHKTIRTKKWHTAAFNWTSCRYLNGLRQRQPAPQLFTWNLRWGMWKNTNKYSCQFRKSLICVSTQTGVSKVWPKEMCDFTFQVITGGNRMGSERQKSHIRASWKEKLKIQYIRHRGMIDNWQQTDLLCKDPVVMTFWVNSHFLSLCYKSSFFLPLFDCWAGSLCMLGLLTVWLILIFWPGDESQKIIVTYFPLKIDMKNPTTESP